jgi:TPR repeat protein
MSVTRLTLNNVSVRGLIALAIAACAGVGAAIAQSPASKTPAAARQVDVPAGQFPPALHRRAFEHADPSARHEVANMLEHGRGVSADPTTAALLYRLAADQGYAPAQFALGRMLRAGSGVTRNDAEAARRLKQAAEQGHFEARRALAELRAPYVQARPGSAGILARPAPDAPAGETTPGRMQTSAGRARSFAEPDCSAIRAYSSIAAAHAVDLCRRAVAGDPASLYRLGVLCLGGTALPRDHAFAVRLLRLAASQGHRPARELLTTLEARSAPSAAPQLRGRRRRARQTGLTRAPSPRADGYPTRRCRSS